MTAGEQDLAPASLVLGGGIGLGAYHVGPLEALQHSYGGIFARKAQGCGLAIRSGYERNLVPGLRGRSLQLREAGKARRTCMSKVSPAAST